MNAMYQNELFIISSSESAYYNSVQSFDLTMNTTQVHESVIDHGTSSDGLKWPTSYISNTNLTFIGGSDTYPERAEQTLNLDYKNYMKTSTRVSSSDSVFKDISTNSGRLIECSVINEIKILT